MSVSAQDRDAFCYFHTMTTRWRDNDVYAHVNNAVFFEYIDTAVNHWLIQRAEMVLPTGDIVGLVVHAECQYFAPLAFPEPVTAGLRVDRVGNTSVTYGVGLFSGEATSTAALAAFTHVYVDAETHTPKRLPELLKGCLKELTVRRRD